ncbi:LuxR C-terminal-related transcriptional regulator [Streptomyces sp. NPDC047108]|uniref:LuxR C-terminal-related transcriptional regulator n=1 Tax=Streptomyces sp. NPDC047108 TaxID=3155025 RepID=UPI0033FB2527
MALEKPDRGWPLVGRDGELEAFERVWAEGQCRAVVVFGAAGVGKSRLADEFLRRAVADGGVRGARATASSAAARVPLGAVAQLVPAGTDLSDPVRVFAAVTSALSGPKGNQRWAVLVDDLHLLDGASAVLLQQLTEAGVVRLIATVRNGEPVSDAVEALAWGNGVHRVDLDAFDPRETEWLLRAGLGGPVGRRTVHRLFEASGGNALYLSELVHGALEAGTLASDGEIWELREGALPGTPRLSELIAQRLDAAPEATRDVLRLLALCEPVSLADAEAMCGLRDLAALEESGLVQVLRDRRRHALVLAHPLYGETLRAGLPALRRRALLLEHVERVSAHGSRRRGDTMHLALWQLAATGTADLALLIRAAVLARHVHDYPQVAQLMEAVPQGEHSRISCLLHGEALTQLGRWEPADVMLAEAEERADAEPDQVAASLARTWNLFWFAARTEPALRVNEAALRRVTGPETRRMLTLNEGAIRAVSGQPARGVELLKDLETDPEQAPNPDAWALAALCRTGGLAYLGRTDEAVAWGMHAYACHLRIQEQQIGSDPVGQLNPVSFSLADAGQLAEARQTAERVLAETMSRAHIASRVWAMHFLGRVEWLAGDVAAARRWHAEAVAEARARNHMTPLFDAWAGLAAAAAVLGDLGAVQEALAEMSAYPPMGHSTGEEDLGQAWLYAAKGDLARARDILARAADKARTTGHVTSEMLLLTDVARLGGAGKVTARLTELAHACDGAFAPARAHLAAALAVDDPEQLFAVSQELHALGAHLLAAEAATTAAATWQRTGDTRRATAATLHAQAEAARCPGARTPLLAAPQATAQLTRREREIAHLAASGTPSKAIAATLHLSNRTVDNHLQHAYAKLGVTTRQQLSHALRHNDTRSPAASRPADQHHGYR